MQTLLDPGLRPDSNPLPDVGHEPAQTTSPRRRRRDASGFTMNELLVVLIIIGVLGLIGTGVYFLFIRDARSTVLNQNIQTAAEEVQSALAIKPSLADTPSALATEMTSRTNFVWLHAAWDSDATANTGDDANTIRFQIFATPATPVLPGNGPAAGPTVEWIAKGRDAVRLHLRNTEGEWRCALVILRPSASGLEAKASVAANAGETKAAEMRGTWYDGGDSQAPGMPGASPSQFGRHDCSPLGAAGGAGDDELPSNAQTWVIDNAGSALPAAQLDLTSTAMAGKRTLHRSPSALDSN